MKMLLFTFFLFTGFVSSAQNDIQPAVDWVNKNAIPLKTVDAENGFDDLDKLDAAIGDARIVAMGECTHGSSEIFRMKHRMLEYLVKRKGFTIFSIEANMPEAYTINEYIINGKGDPKKLMAGMYFWTWNTQEVLNMILWMKKYNDTAAKKIMFTGFDMQFTKVSSGIVRAYLEKNNPSLLHYLNEYDSAATPDLIVKKNSSNGIFVTKKTAAQNILDGLSSGNQKDTAFAWAQQNARILWQYAANHKSDPGRDESMAENIKWIAAQNPDAKIMLWAHNEHIRKAESKFSGPMMGSHLKEAFGKNYVAVGFSTEEGTYTAFKKKISVDSANILTPSKKWTCEYIFKNASADNFILDLRQAQQGDEGTLWVFGKTALRTLGARVNDKFQFVDIHPIRDYDMLIFLKHSNSSKCFNVK